MKKAVFNILLVLVFCLSTLMVGCSSSSVGSKTYCSAVKNKKPASVVRKDDIEVIKTSWGSLQWLVSGNNGASEKMTLGRVTFKPGQSNPPHFHPNCEEILYVVSGELEHSLPEGGTALLRPGDSIVLHRGQKHHAKNIGTDEAVVIVVFDSAYRETVGE